MLNLNFKEITSLHDLNFPVACTDICISSNGKKLLATGIYKPTVKLFDVKSGIIKFERHLVSDPVKNFFLDEEGEKFAILRNDKTIEFHIKGGLHEKVKTIKQPHDIILNRFSAELYIGGNYGEINRFSLEQGRFMKSIPCTGATRLAFSETNTLLGAIFKNNVTFIDTKSKNEIFKKQYEEDAITISQDASGLKYLVGFESGKILEYDLRSSKAIREIELDNFPIKTCYSDKFIVANTSESILFIESDAVKVECMPSITPGFIINTFCLEGGVIFVGGESQSIKTYISEDFGKVPDWVCENFN